MAIVIGTAGGSATRKGWVGRLGLPIVILTLSTIVAVAAAWALRSESLSHPVVFAFLAAEIVFLLWKDRDFYFELIDDLHASSSWLLGAEGERRVGAYLNSLSDEFTVFHDYRPTDGEGGLRPWNLDHIVVGPNGVFVVETKMYSRQRVLPSDQDSSTRTNVRQVSQNAVDLKDRLRLWSGGALSDVFVEAMLVYAQDGAHVEQLREGTTQVLPLKYLMERIIGRSKGDLTQEQAYRVARALVPMLSEARQSEAASELARLDSLYGQARTAGVSSRAVADAKPKGIPTDCPDCGAALVRRVAKRGPHKGRPFMGCSRWGLTGCRYKLDLEERPLEDTALPSNLGLPTRLT